MPLSKARMRIRKRIDRALAKGNSVNQAMADAVSNPSSIYTALALEERHKVLKEIALHAIETPVTAGQKIAAIKEANLMEHIYDEKPQLGNRIINIFVSSREAKELAEKVVNRFRELEEKTDQETEID